MKKKEISYSELVLLHILIGISVYFLPLFSKLYALAIVLLGFYIIIKKKNANNEALYVAAYVVGAEVFLRMTGGNFGEQFAKYVVMGSLGFGMYYRGFSKNALLYFVFMILLIPGIIVGTLSLNFETDIRKAITFNIIGPVCLAVSAIYCYRRKISLSEMMGVVNALAFPILTTVTYMYLYTPSIKDVVTNTDSNFQTSGGFGPNQVSTILGLGIFLFFSKIMILSKSKKHRIIDIIILGVITFRGIVTFSRGGVIAGGIMIVLLLAILFLTTKSAAKSKIARFVALVFFLLVGIWTYSSIQTGGLINKRYANQDARGRIKKSKLTGRERLIESEFQMFLDNPILGIGVGKNKEYREEMTGIEAASHNEVSRMLAEHGSLGVVCLLILLITPLVLYLDNRQHLFLLSFVVFWLLTINHAAMRIAAPAFVYALSLLKVYALEKPAVPRE
ncbi:MULTISPECIES: O-antigen ligase family protein [Flavobacterium]|uniref:O-antigen ligase family protein n=1 Tax=Flavobacterium TaxID=237 RepID=UPI001FCAA6C9|nr:MULTISPECIES: O-antigen ligase family protein [Flavobacterium]UOK43800.1 O-antigen ligase family protein [Flavobacterium enshiense]